MKDVLLMNPRGPALPDTATAQIRGRLASCLGAHELVDRDGQLRSVIAYRCQINDLVYRLVANGFRLESQDHPGHEGVLEVAGVSLLDVRRGVLIGPWEAIDCIVQNKASLDRAFGEGAVREMLQNHMPAPRSWRNPEGDNADPAPLYRSIDVGFLGIKVSEEQTAQPSLPDSSSTVKSGPAEQARILREIDAAARDRGALVPEPERPRFLFFVWQFPGSITTFDFVVWKNRNTRHEFLLVKYEDWPEEDKLPGTPVEDDSTGWELSAPYPWHLAADEGLGVCLYSPDGQIRLIAADALDAARAGQHGFRVERELPR